MNPRKLALLVLMGVMVLTVGAYAATLGVTDTADIGATGPIDVVTPDTDNTISKIRWNFNPSSWAVNQVLVEWQPRDTTSGGARYNIYVNVYSDNSCSTIAGSGTLTGQDPTTTTVTSTVNLSSAVDASLVECVKVAIVEQ